MSKILLGAVAVLLVLVSCAPEAALETLIPSNAMAVVYIEHPLDVLADGSVLAKALGQADTQLPGDFPFAALDLSRPMAAAVLPIAGAEDAGVPTLVVYLPIKEPKNVAEFQTFASKQGGLTAYQIGGQLGNWAVLATAGAAVPLPLPDGKYFELKRARLTEGRGISVYVSMKGVMDSMVFPEGFTEELKYLPALQKELDGVRLGVYATVAGAAPGGLGASGVRVTLETDLKPGSSWKSSLALLSTSTHLEDWALWLDDSALVSLGLALPPVSAAEDPVWATVGDKQLVQHLKNLRALIGPRVAVNLSAGLEPGAPQPVFSGVLEAKDPQAVRQALKSFIASGAIQKNFLQFAMDADTPLVYQDQPGGPLGVRSRLALGPFQVNFAWGKDKVYFASGKESAAVDALTVSGRVARPWNGTPPASASLLASASPGAWAKVFQDGTNPLEGLLKPASAASALQASLQVQSDGNPRLQLWWGAGSLKAVAQAAGTALGSLLTPQATP